MRILLIEDDRAITDYLDLAFKANMPEAELTTARFGEEGLIAAREGNPDLVVLDLGLPDMDGFEVLKRLRIDPRTLILILTARGDEKDIVKGLEWGADDYVVKPFRQLELLARIRTLLRRQIASLEPGVISCGSLTLDTARNDVSTSSGAHIDLTRTEGLILAQLMRQNGHVVEHKKLAETIWGEDYPGSVNALRVYMGRLRRKLGLDEENDTVIRSKAGVGYFISPAETSATKLDVKG